MKQQILIIVAHLGKWEESTSAEEQLQWQSCCYKKWAWLEQVPSQKRQASCQERCASSRYELCTEIFKVKLIHLPNLYQHNFVSLRELRIAVCGEFDMPRPYFLRKT